MLWTALKLDDHTFAIFDTFTDAAARDAHFSGQVAAALKGQADRLVVGGWDLGVLPNVTHFEVMTQSIR